VEALVERARGKRRGARSKSVEGVKVFVDEEVAHLVGELSGGLPEEGGDIVVDRASAPTLKVDEVGLTVFQHDVA
jgi:hypothetical protein